MAVISSIRVNRSNLLRGIEYIYSYQKKKGAPSIGVWDFHNGLYLALATYRKNGILPTYWQELVDILWDWQAIRGVRGITKEYIFEEGKKRMDKLIKYYQKIYISSNKQYSLENVKWNDVVDLFTTSQDIKGVASPVFASKFCHFLLPHLYPIIDNTLVKGTWNTYHQYWEACKKGWLECREKETLIKILKDEIPGDVCPEFPWCTKIVELCTYTG